MMSKGLKSVKIEVTSVGYFRSTEQQLRTTCPNGRAGKTEKKEVSRLRTGAAPHGHGSRQSARLSVLFIHRGFGFNFSSKNVTKNLKMLD